jgi:glucosamine--fructose-6-phosphate aminotransferase (isomerizing)
MCGIVGYTGFKPAKDILIEGLKSLEYRGYDSSGLALLGSNGEISVVKSVGKISQLEAKINETIKTPVNAGFSTGLKSLNFGNNTLIESNCGIGHTRWATHGKPSDINSHPHQDSSGDVALVHNGIIKNYYQLKQELIEQGENFISETDTEVIVRLFAQMRKTQKDDVQALIETIKKLEGSYAIALILKNKNTILAAKSQSPLVIGIGENENYLASDSSTVLQFTDKILRLKDLQIAVISPDEVSIFDLDYNKQKNEINQCQQVSSILNKGPYKHFLLKEIHEQAGVISRMLSGFETAFKNINIDFKSISRISFTACGSAYHSALIGKYLIESWTRIPVEVALASEFCSSTPVLDANHLVIGISQSGETADTLSAVKLAQDNGSKTMAITNKQDSALYEMCYPNNYVTPAGIEVSVASTKAFTSQVMALYMLACHIRETSLGLDCSDIKKELHELPLIIDQVVEREESYKNQFLKYATYRDFLFLSRGINYPIALEGALKLKELSYIHATGYPSGEMKHGPIAILDSKVPVLNIAINGPSELEQTIYKKTLSNAEEAKARLSPSLVVACDSNPDVNGLFDEVIYIPDIKQIYSPIIACIPLQYLAYFIAQELGKDVDQPRNLAKSVTVE